MTEQECFERFQAAVVAAGGQRRFALQHKLTPSYINDILNKRRGLSDRVLDILGIEKVVTVEYRERRDGHSNNKP